MEMVIVAIVAWSLVGSIVMFTTFEMISELNNITLHWLSPCFIYKHIKVNWFGAICLMILFNLLSPMLSMCYWFYRLCTVGRK